MRISAIQCNLVTGKASRKEDGTNLKYFEIKLQDIGQLFWCFLSVVRNDVSHLHYVIIVIQS